MPENYMGYVDLGLILNKKTPSRKPGVTLCCLFSGLFILPQEPCDRECEQPYPEGCGDNKAWRDEHDHTC